MARSMLHMLLLVSMLVAATTIIIGHSSAIGAPNASNAITRDPSALRLSVDAPGIVSVSAEDLSAAGWPIASVDSGTIRLWNHDHKLALDVVSDVAGHLTALRFLAQASDAPATRTAAYWLTYGGGAGLRATLPAQPLRSLAWEVEQLYEPSQTTARGDSWFSGELRRTTPTLSAHLTLAQGVPAGATLEVGLTPRVIRSGHQIAVRANSAALGTLAWSDAAAGPITQTLTLSAPLAAGQVTLDLSLQSSDSDAVLVDQIILGGGSVFAPLPRVTLQRPAAFDLRRGPGPGMLGADDLIITHSRFQSALGPLVAAHRQSGRSVAVVDVQDIYDAFSAGERDPEAIRALLMWARTQWSPSPRLVLLVGAGTARMRGWGSPDAAIDATAMDRPDTSASLSVTPPADPFIPPYLVRGVDASGAIACDTCYARLDTADVRDDLTPELAVGRLPVRTIEEATTVVAKTVGMLTAPPAGAWRSRVLVLSDNDVEADGSPDPAGSFEETAETVIHNLPRGLDIHRFYYAPSQPTNRPHYRETGVLRCELFRALDGGSSNDTRCAPNPAGMSTGASLLVYVGHASPWQMANTGDSAGTPYLLYLYDADGRHNESRLPILLALTCLNGDIANPVLQTQSERMVLWPAGGAAAAFAASGSGVNRGHAQLAQRLIPALTAPTGDRSLGAAHLAAIATLPVTYRDLAYSFAVLGDPMLSLPYVPTSALYLPQVIR
jgi:hypothetical protein